MAKLMTNKHISTICFLCMVLIINLPSSTLAATTEFNVLNFGAKPNGLTDTSKAFVSAWEAACETNGPTSIVVPKGRYLLHPVQLSGVGCKSGGITFYIDGTIVAPLDYRVLGGVDRWVGFDRVDGVTIAGRGFFDAKGASLWDCKKGKNGDKCPLGATTLTFTSSNNIVIKGITSLNSQLYHIVINVCKNVLIEDVKIRAAGNSPNTDGIHVQVSSEVTIINTNVKTGDDCVSIGPGTKNLWIERITCGPSHGISIGSLAKSMDEEGVQNVTVKTAVISYSTTGVRIKSWGRPSNGFVQGIVFQDILMRYVWNPIIIDQNYCPHNINCPGKESGVEVTDVKYEHIRGISLSEVAVKLDCSGSNPCTGIQLQNINLTYADKEAQSYCKNAVGEVKGLVTPQSCLNSDTDFHSIHLSG
ncbi:polygalacturonase-like [Spinacia oleracea]|uniref:Polygalacturonase-like n=1 Tax=Spinacia oleracea TaxID=3562 RepID=A0A9R0I5S5_SPIOL|nr:polygalacturonase-like [Spinacia oleracea]